MKLEPCVMTGISLQIPIRYLHSIGLARSCLAISKDANVISIYTGCDEWLNFLEHLRDKDQE